MNLLESRRPMVLLSGSLLLLLGSAAGVAAPEVPHTKYYERVIPDRLEYRMSVDRQGVFTAGDPIRVKFTLTNLRDEPIRVCKNCVAAGIQIDPEATPLVRFSVSPPDIERATDTLAPGASVSRVIDVSRFDCVRGGTGKIEVNGSYCYRDDRRGKPIDTCVRGGPITIEVRPSVDATPVAETRH